MFFQVLNSMSHQVILFQIKLVDGFDSGKICGERLYEQSIRQVFVKHCILKPDLRDMLKLPEIGLPTMTRNDRYTFLSQRTASDNLPICFVYL